MPYFHVITSYISKNTRRPSRQFRYDCNEETLRKEIVEPLKNGNTFLFGNSVIYPELIEAFGIYETEKSLKQIISDRTPPPPTSGFYFPL